MGLLVVALFAGWVVDARAEESLGHAEVTPEWMVFGALDGDNFGDAIAVASVGETPFAVAVSASHAAGGGLLRGCVYLFPIGPTGISESAQDLLCGETDGSQFGLGLAWLGDVDGNSQGDLLIAARDAVYRVDVGINGFGDSLHEVRRFEQASWPSISAAGDLDDDLLADFVVGDDITGTVGIYMDSPTEPDHVLVAPEGWEGGFGGVVMSGEDINADGSPDLVVLAGPESESPGGGFVWFNRGGWFADTSDWQLPTDISMSAHGGRLADVDGDELADLIVFDSGANEGPASIAQYQSSDMRYGETEPFVWFDLSAATHEPWLRSATVVQWDGRDNMDLVVGDGAMQADAAGPGTGGFWTFAGFENQPYDLWDGVLVTLANHSPDDGRPEFHGLAEVVLRYPGGDQADGLLVGAPGLGMGDGQRKGAVFLMSSAGMTYTDGEPADSGESGADTGEAPGSDAATDDEQAKSGCGCSAASGAHHWAWGALGFVALARRRQ